MPQSPNRKARKIPLPSKGSNTSWGPVAGWYDDLLSQNDTYQERVILPNLLRLVDPKPGERILDVACGQGYFSKAFRSKGALVVGVDISQELIEKARASIPEGTFFVSPAHRLKSIADGSMDKAAMVLAAQNIQEFDEAAGEIARALSPSGSFTLVLNHPAFRIPKRSRWEFDPKTDTQYRRLDGYLSESRSEINMHPGEKRSERTVSFHRPLQYYFKVLTKHGFTIDRLEEWTSHKESVGKRAKAENHARKEFPLFLALRAISRVNTA